MGEVPYTRMSDPCAGRRQSSREVSTGPEQACATTTRTSALHEPGVDIRRAQAAQGHFGGNPALATPCATRESRIAECRQRCWYKARASFEQAHIALVDGALGYPLQDPQPRTCASWVRGRVSWKRRLAGTSRRTLGPAGCARRSRHRRRVGPHPQHIVEVRRLVAPDHACHSGSTSQAPSINQLSRRATIGSMRVERRAGR